jgi:hypothetical protein
LNEDDGSGNTQIGCYCAYNDGYNTVDGCDQLTFTAEEAVGSTWREVDYSLILDMRNYKRSSSSAKTFLLVRDNGQKYANWQAIYSGILTDSSYARFIQSGDTILKPSVSVDALRTHSNKEVLRHLPNQYFTT